MKILDELKHDELELACELRLTFFFPTRFRLVLVVVRLFGDVELGATFSFGRNFKIFLVASKSPGFPGVFGSNECFRERSGSL